MTAASTGPGEGVKRFVTLPDDSRMATYVLHEVPGSLPVLVVPGGPGRASVYLGDLAGAWADRTVVRVDPRGSGRSDLPDDRAALGFPSLARDLETVRLALGIERWVVAGHSAGCYVALAYATLVAPPGVLAGLVLLTPPGGHLGVPGAQERIDADVERIHASRAAEPWYDEVAAAKERQALMPPRARSRVDRDLRPLFYGRWDEAARAHAASTDAQVSLRAGEAFAPSDPAGQADAAAMVEALPSLALPVQVVVGSRDGITGVEAGHVVASLLTGADVTVDLLEGAGHYPWIDEPHALRRAVDDWTARVA